MRPIHTDFCDYDDAACAEHLHRTLRRETSLVEVTDFQKRLAKQAADLLSRCRALLTGGDRVAAVKLYRTETNASLPAAMRALGLK
jgi:hypothetical protein